MNANSRRGSFQNRVAKFIWFIMCAAGGEQYVEITCRRGQFRRYRTQAYSNILMTRN